MLTCSKVKSKCPKFSTNFFPYDTLTPLLTIIHKKEAANRKDEHSYSIEESLGEQTQ